MGDEASHGEWATRQGRDGWPPSRGSCWRTPRPAILTPTPASEELSSMVMSGGRVSLAERPSRLAQRKQRDKAGGGGEGEGADHGRADSGPCARVGDYGFSQWMPTARKADRASGEHAAAASGSAGKELSRAVGKELPCAALGRRSDPPQGSSPPGGVT